MCPGGVENSGRMAMMNGVTARSTSAVLSLASLLLT